MSEPPLPQLGVKDPQDRRSNKKTVVIIAIIVFVALGLFALFFL